jgi:hypothetical protein
MHQGVADVNLTLLRIRATPIYGWKFNETPSLQNKAEGLNGGRARF